MNRIQLLFRHRLAQVICLALVLYLLHSIESDMRRASLFRMLLITVFDQNFYAFYFQHTVDPHDLFEHPIIVLRHAWIGLSYFLIAVICVHGFGYLKIKWGLMASSLILGIVGAILFMPWSDTRDLIESPYLWWTPVQP